MKSIVILNEINYIMIKRVIIKNMNETPLVSVVIPVYNGSNYLRETVDSALAQTYNNIEILVIDDGSNDDTWDIITSYGDKIRGFHKENGGVSTALNMAIDYMNGEWFGWLSHDDLWLPNKILHQINFLKKNPQSKMCYTGYYHIDSSGDCITGTDPLWYPKGSDLRHMIKYGNYINGISVLIHKDCFSEVGKFKTEYRCVQDRDMWIRIMIKYDICMLNEKLVKTRKHRNQVGVRYRSRCVQEDKNIKKELLKNTELSVFYPSLSDSHLNLFNRLFITLRAHIFIMYIYAREISGFAHLEGYLLRNISILCPKSIKSSLMKCMR